MRETLKKGKLFLRNLRRSDEPTKKKWVYSISGVSSLLILFLWVAYLNVTLPSVPPFLTATSPSATVPYTDSSDSFFSVLGRGFKKLSTEISQGVKTITDAFSTANTYSVTPASTPSTTVITTPP